MSRFEQVLTEAVAVQRQLVELQGRTKLSAESFVALACCEAGIDEKELRAAVQKIDAHMDSPPIGAFIRRLRNAYSEARYGRPHRAEDAAKLVHVYGHADTAGMLAEAGVKIMTASAVAAFKAAERGPQFFGTIDDWAAHAAKITDAQDQLNRLLSVLKQEYTARDLVEEGDGLRFQIARHLSPTMREWPRQLVEFVATHHTDQPTERRKLREAAA